MSELKLWKVAVLCEGIVPALLGAKKPKPSQIQRQWTTVLLEAPDSDTAMKAAKKYADSNASGEVRWEQFTPMSASRFVLPMAVEDLR